jgi:hypothetical protein
MRDKLKYDVPVPVLCTGSIYRNQISDDKESVWDTGIISAQTRITCLLYPYCHPRVAAADGKDCGQRIAISGLQSTAPIGTIVAVYLKN